MASPYILVVDDDSGIQAFIRMSLSDEGYAIQAAGDGAAALRKIATEAPALILLDMQMPTMSGGQFLVAYRQQPPPHAPVIVLSANAGIDHTINTLNVEAMLRKPFDLDQLIQVVARFWPPG